jgi:cellulose biosynthesis protein BcsQ
VGKTASAVNLAWLAARSGTRTLLWDLDPQAAATYTFRIAPGVRGGARALLNGADDLAESIRGSDFSGLDVLPADFSYRTLDALFDEVDDPALRLRALLARLGAEYDLVLLDCPPGLSRVAEAVFSSADALLAPTVPTTLSLRTLAQLMKHLKKRAERPRVLPFFCMVDARKSLHRDVVRWVTERELGFLDAKIPYASPVERMGVERAPLFSFAASSAAARAYEALWREIETRLANGTVPPEPVSRDARHTLEQIARGRPDRAPATDARTSSSTPR